ncbi:GNAT family N-acetyltransferase [Heyndrickxia oleronia]|uniref:GNAT family N-acetyltransferase n=1 Tax=Heyndrickxia oleronia TaxID=38875 RepID=UPI001B2528A8|nr:GNAT family protein [Heyndrickxia oleronia]GIN39382.1 N-acetyltransferase [Heyndrickxia oleronia]
MKIETNRLLIKTFEKHHLNDVYEIYNDDSTCRYLLHDKWTHENKEREFDKKLNNNQLTKEKALSLAVLMNDRVIGDLSIWYTDMKDTVEIGYTFSKSVSGQGYATEAVIALINHLFEVVKVHRIQANLDARNTASEKLCRRVGMRKEAHFIQDFWNKNEWTDSIVFGMLKTDFNKFNSERGNH